MMATTTSAKAYWRTAVGYIGHVQCCSHCWQSCWPNGKVRLAGPLLVHCMGSAMPPSLITKQATLPRSGVTAAPCAVVEPGHLRSWPWTPCLAATRAWCKKSCLPTFPDQDEDPRCQMAWRMHQNTHGALYAGYMYRLAAWEAGMFQPK